VRIDIRVRRRYPLHVDQVRCGIEFHPRDMNLPVVGADLRPLERKSLTVRGKRGEAVIKRWIGGEVGYPAVPIELHHCELVRRAAPPRSDLESNLVRVSGIENRLA